MVVDISELDAEGNIAITEVAARLKTALDVERVTKRFYKEFQQQQLDFLDLIEGIADERQRRWYASVLLNRLMFICFLQRKYFLDGGTRVISKKNWRHPRRAAAIATTPDFFKLFSSKASPSPRRSAARPRRNSSARSTTSTAVSSCLIASKWITRKSASRT